MKYIISRASKMYSNDDIPPCEEAHKENLPYYDIKDFTEEEYNRKFAKTDGKWKDKGTGHTITSKGYLKRYLGISQELYCIELNTLEELQAFCQKYGPVVIEYDESYCLSDIQIYDYYIE